MAAGWQFWRSRGAAAGPAACESAARPGAGRRLYLPRASAAARVPGRRAVVCPGPAGDAGDTPGPRPVGGPAEARAEASDAGRTAAPAGATGTARTIGGGQGGPGGTGRGPNATAGDASS